jgi:hypothetical protein
MKSSAAEAGFVCADADVTPRDKTEENGRNSWYGNNVRLGWISDCENYSYVLKEFREKHGEKSLLRLNWRISNGSDDREESYCLCIWNVRQISLAICLYKDAYFFNWGETVPLVGSEFVLQ